MSSDSVELILAIEDAFQIHIEDEEASRASTVDDVYNLIIGKLQGQDTKLCLTSAAFYRTRRAIIETLGMKRGEIGPSTRLEVILPRNHRREKWRRIQDSMKLRLPALQHPAPVQLALLAMGVALAVIPGIYGTLGFGWIVPLCFFGLVIGAFLLKLSPALAVGFPNHDVTVGDLARDILAINHARFVAEAGGWNKKEVWETLCRVIVMQTAVAREKISPEALIGADLGID